MSNTKVKKNKENDLKILQDELEKALRPCCGPGYRRSNQKSPMAVRLHPTIMVVKAVSEVLELFRGEAQALLRQLKMRPCTWGKCRFQHHFSG